MIRLSFTPRGSAVRARHRPLTETPAIPHKTSGRQVGRSKYLPTVLPTVTLFAVTAILLLIPSNSLAKADKCNHYASPFQAIDCVFPVAQRAKAKDIARCESTAQAPEHIARRNKLGRWAKNGQYVGVFQIGYAERKAHGFYRRGASALIQVQTAYRLYQARGWQPWQGWGCA
jgi:hypothetical protein